MDMTSKIFTASAASSKTKSLKAPGEFTYPINSIIWQNISIISASPESLADKESSAVIKVRTEEED